MDRRVKLAARLGVGLLAVAVALLSLLPRDYRLHTGVLSGKLEHALAYLLLGAVMTIAARRSHKPHRVALALVAYAGVLELGQLIISSRREATIGGFVASAGGAILGVSITTLAFSRFAR